MQSFSWVENEMVVTAENVRFVFPLIIFHKEIPR